MTDLGALGPVTQIEAGELDVGYVDLGRPDRPAVLLLHGWPYDIHTYAEVAPLLVEAGYRVVVPYLCGYGTTRFRAAAEPLQRARIQRRPTNPARHSQARSRGRADARFRRKLSPSSTDSVGA